MLSHCIYSFLSVVSPGLVNFAKGRRADFISFHGYGFWVLFENDDLPQGKFSNRESMSLKGQSVFTVRLRLQHPKPEGKQDAT